MSKFHGARLKLGSELEAQGYGLGGHPVPPRHIKQFKYPFQREKAASE